MTKQVKIAPSILSADFSKMAEEVKKLENGGADIIHCDVMDGVFVPSLTFGSKMVADVKKSTKLPLDVHLMTTHPIKHIESMALSGADIISFHIEADSRAGETLKLIKSFGCKAGLAVCPDTKIDLIKPFLEYCDMILIMSVVPGKGGQAFIQGSCERIAYARKLAGQNILIEVDGGITLTNATDVINSGADIIVAGNTIFGSVDFKATINALRG